MFEVMRWFVLCAIAILALYWFAHASWLSDAWTSRMLRWSQAPAWLGLGFLGASYLLGMTEMAAGAWSDRVWQLYLALLFVSLVAVLVHSAVKLRAQTQQKQAATASEER